MSHDTGQNSLTISLALLAGLGLTLMIVAAGIGVIQGDSADGELLGLLFVGGIAALVVGGVAWGGVVRPWENFDDINQPLYHGHEHDHAEEDHAETEEETAAAH